MAQDVITTGILIIAAVIAVAVLITAVYPALFTVTGSITGTSSKGSDVAMSHVEVVMSSVVNSSALQVWVKNTGSTAVPANEIAYTDVYYGSTDNMARATPGTSSGLGWTYSLSDTDGDEQWSPGETLAIVLYDPGHTQFGAGDHEIKLVLYNGASFEDTITI